MCVCGCVCARTCGCKCISLVFVSVGGGGSQEVKPVLLYNFAGRCQGVYVYMCACVCVCMCPSFSACLCAWLGAVGSLPGKHIANYHLPVPLPNALPPHPRSQSLQRELQGGCGVKTPKLVDRMLAKQVTDLERVNNTHVLLDVSLPLSSVLSSKPQISIYLLFCL